MKKAVLLSLILVVSMGLAGSASATHLENLVLTGDCDGWSVSGDVVTGYTSINLTYTIGLYEGMTLIEEISDSDLIYGADGAFSYDGMWTAELCGEYYVKGTLVLSLSTFSLTEELMTPSFVCDCPSGVCTGTPGYWKNHPDAWPVDELVIGDVTFYKMELMDIFGWSANEGKDVKLFHHLVAAKLNVLRGATYEGIGDAIAAADDFFIMYPFGSELDKDARGIINELKAPLEMFNEYYPCDGYNDPYDRDDYMLGASPDGNEKDKSWGAIKKIYE